MLSILSMRIAIVLRSDDDSSIAPLQGAITSAQSSLLARALLATHGLSDLVECVHRGRLRIKCGSRSKPPCAPMHLVASKMVKLSAICFAC